MELQRIYHRYENWECYKAGFFNTLSFVITSRQEFIDKVVELFSDAVLTELYMKKVIIDWPNSTEHNLTNTSMNRVAWLGQSACCIYASVPSILTMEAWHHVSEECREKANKIAENIISEYEQNLLR